MFTKPLKKIVLASHNKGKIAEFKELLTPFDIEIIPQSDFGIEEIEEHGQTFVENALIKARYTAEQTGLPTLADDSGLVVAALSGAPGIHSARYAGARANAQQNIQKLLMAMKNIPANQRQAYFFCVLVLMTHAKDQTPLICQGKWHGSILESPKGTAGFGYDPIFYDPIEQQTAAELPAAKKNKISHRGIALQLLTSALPKI